MQKIEEYRISKNLTKENLLNASYDIFSGNALHWFRDIRPSVNSWDELVQKLKCDFDSDDYDYKLMSEIRERTQGDSETIVVYLSIMNGLFSRLNKIPSDQDKFDIVSHNIKPCYAEVLAVANVTDLDELKTTCQNYEKYKARTNNYHDPPKVGPSTLAPEFAYTKHNYTKNNYNRPSLYPNSNTNYDSRYTNKPFYPKRPFVQQSSHNSPNTGNVPVVAKIDTTPTVYERVNNNTFCPRCRVSTHSLRGCRAERFPVCFKCGEKGVKFPDCKKCSTNVSKN